MSENETTQDQQNNPEVNHVKDMIDSLAQGDNIGAEKSFKDGLAGKISAALDNSRQDVAAAWLNEPQAETEADYDNVKAPEVEDNGEAPQPIEVTSDVPSDPKPEVIDPSPEILPDEKV